LDDHASKSDSRSHTKTHTTNDAAQRTQTCKALQSLKDAPNCFAPKSEPENQALYIMPRKLETMLFHHVGNRWEHLVGSFIMSATHTLRVCNDGNIFKKAGGALAASAITTTRVVDYRPSLKRGTEITNRPQPCGSCASAPHGQRRREPQPHPRRNPSSPPQARGVWRRRPSPPRPSCRRPSLF